MNVVTDPGRERPGSVGPESDAAPDELFSTTGLVVKIVLLGIINALVIWALPTMVREKDYPFAIASVIGLVLIDVVYLSPRRLVAAKYLLPGTLFLLIFAVYPVLHTIYTSTTNYGTGNILSKERAIDQIERNSVGAGAEAVRYELQVLAEGSPTGPLAYLLTDPEGRFFLGTADGVRPLDLAEIDESGTRDTVAGYVALNLGQTQDRKTEIEEFVVPSEQGDIVNDGFRAAFAQLQRLQFDAESNTMIDAVDGTTYTVDDGYFVDDAGRRLLPGWRSSVGTDNYERLFTDDDVRGPFLRVFVWTVVFSLVSVATTFALGLALAMVFNNQRMKGRRIYRSLIILPYAIPTFMTALVWRGMFNQSFGVINRWLGINAAWLDGQWLPYLSILIVNLWLGYPYMWLVCTGALQSIPADLNEAAFVDGATGPYAFRRITFPLLMTAVAPLLIASFAFNFNNFNIIYLLTEGRPPISGSEAGRTDILITYTYKLAFASGRGVDYGFASAVSLIVFIVVAAISAFSFRYTRSFEEIR
jgi:arabinogalactan oligomer/maltooligosaccharide transport system permease protein